MERRLRKEEAIRPRSQHAVPRASSRSPRGPGPPKTSGAGLGSSAEPSERRVRERLSPPGATVRIPVQERGCRARIAGWPARGRRSHALCSSLVLAGPDRRHRVVAAARRLSGVGRRGRRPAPEAPGGCHADRPADGGTIVGPEAGRRNAAAGDAAWFRRAARGHPVPRPQEGRGVSAADRSRQHRIFSGHAARLRLSRTSSLHEGVDRRRIRVVPTHVQGALQRWRCALPPRAHRPVPNASSEMKASMIGLLMAG